ncbi:MAG: NAD(P)-dependent oxidoreductase [Bacteroidota bacterium]
MTNRILFIDTAHPILKDELEKMGFQCDYFGNYKRVDFINCINEYFGVIIRSKITLDKEILSKAENLKFIGRLGAGMESIDLEYATEKGIKCLSTPEGNRNGVGEQAIGMLISLMNNVVTANNQIKNGIWLREENRGIEISGKTIGIIGYGNMGSSFAKKLAGFDANVIAYDKYKTNYSDAYVKETSLEELFEKCDIVSIHVPLTEETRYMVSEKFIYSFKKPFYLVNTARGPVVNTIDLVEALKCKKILGAALDVIEYEETSFEVIKGDSLPSAYQYLCDSCNVVLTPHIAGWTHESLRKHAEVMIEKIKSELSKKV